MTIQIKQIMKDLENPTELENKELAITLHILDLNGIEYDLEPPIKKEVSL